MLVYILLIMLRCLIETLIVEIGIGYLLGYRKKDILFITLVNILTNPLVVATAIFIQMQYGIEGYEISIIFLEIFAFIVEAAIYKYALTDKKINYFTLSLILNASSYGIGEIINIIIRLLF